jgi:hypothetical protein
MKFTNLQRKTVSLIVLVSFVALLHLWATPAPAATRAGNSETTIAQGNSGGPNFIEEDSHKSHVSRKERKSKLWLILAAAGVVGIGLAVYFLFIKKKSTDTSTDLPGGTGQVKVTLQWHNCADLDLWVADPCGTTIYYNSTSSTCQGKVGNLDIDSNAGCYTLNCTTPAENIYWVTAPSGTYTVCVNYYSSCSGTASTSYLLTTIVDGKLSTYSGSINPDETKVVTTFSR